MRPAIVWTVLRREWYETIRNRLLMSTIILPPILLTVAPIVLASAVGAEQLPPELAQQILQQRPEWSTFTPGELAGAFAVQQFLVFFLLMPAYIPLSIATFSIIGEKQARSLEPVLAAPIRTSELLAGKAVAALVPGLLAGWATYAIFVILASLVYGPALFGVVTDPSWLAGVFLLGPAVGLSSVVAGVIVSARVNDPRVAQQIGGVVIVPVIGLVLLQATGTLLVGPAGYLLLSAAVLAIAALVPGLLAGWATYAIFVILASLVYGPALFGVVTDPSWLAGVFLLGPAVGLSSVVAGVIVSARVNDPRVAQQIGGVVIVPVIGLVLLQATGTLLVGPAGYLLLSAVVLAIAVVGLRIGVRLFDREAILTRWR